MALNPLLPQQFVYISTGFVLLAGAPKAKIDKLQRLLNAAARLVSDTRKFDRGLSQLMYVDLHWLDVPEGVKYKLVSMVHK